VIAEMVTHGQDDSRRRVVLIYCKPIGPNDESRGKEVSNMPLAQLKGLSGFLSAEQKGELIRKVTDAIVSVEGEGLRPVTWVIIEEVPSGNWGVGGTPVTTDALKKMAAQGK
jgi:4-oxalocrotonate tautomerase